MKAVANGRGGVYAHRFRVKSDVVPLLLERAGDWTVRA